MRLVQKQVEVVEKQALEVENGWWRWKMGVGGGKWVVVVENRRWWSKTGGGGGKQVVVVVNGWWWL